VSSFDDANSVGERVLADFGRVDILVNNAGITRDRLFLRMSADDWNAVLNVNLTGAFNVTKAFAPAMLKQRSGCVVNIASVVGQMGNAGQANYSASKAGMIGLTKSLAKEFAPRGVRVNAVAPGFIRTPMTDSLSEDVQGQMKQAIPLGRFGETGDVASVVMFLVSDASAYVTGQVINCDGGLVMAR
jgi:3-oxoacyl-[acyl-carrier protein] reductase